MFSPFDLPGVAKCYGHVWVQEAACAHIAGMFFHAKHPLTMQLEEAVPHQLARIKQPVIYGERKVDQCEFFWMIRFHFWPDRVIPEKEIVRPETHIAVNTSNGHMVTSVRNDTFDPRQFQLVEYGGDLEQIKRDLLILRLYVK